MHAPPGEKMASMPSKAKLMTEVFVTYDKKSVRIQWSFVIKKIIVLLPIINILIYINIFIIYFFMNNDINDNNILG